MIFAVLGDIHGRFDMAARRLSEAASKLSQRISFALQVGDMEAHAEPGDLSSMYAPYREKRPGDFAPYAAGEKIFPVPMYCIAGNHESYNGLSRYPDGMELARNIYYLGASGRFDIEGMMVVYLSGIDDYRYYEESRTRRPVVREDGDWDGQRRLSAFTAQDLARVSCLSAPDVLLVHEWPRGVVRPEHNEPPERGHRALRSDGTGSERIRGLVMALQPDQVFCGHMHRFYDGQMPTGNGHRARVTCLAEVSAEEGGCVVYEFAGGRLNRLWP